jgi:DNA-binding transcriptional ArsR family regulator
VLQGTGLRTPPVHCTWAGCTNATTGGKPVCSEHHHGLPYPRRLELELERRAREEVLVAKRGARAVDVQGVRVREILWLLEDEPVELPELARRTDLAREILERFLAALRRAGLVRVERRESGQTYACRA